MTSAFQVILWPTFGGHLDFLLSYTLASNSTARRNTLIGTIILQFSLFCEPGLFLIPFLLYFRVFDRIYHQSYRTIICHFNIHILPKSPREYLISLPIQFTEFLQKIIIQNFCLFSIHSIVKIRFGSAKLMIECELRDQQYLILHILH